MSTGANLRFCHLPPKSADDIAKFYEDAPSEHLYPRTTNELADIACSGCLFGVRRANEIVAACYVKWDDPDRGVREFGGVRLAPELQGKGVAQALGRLAIGVSLVQGKPAQLLANVHKENMAPNKLLATLGFSLLIGRTATLPPEAVRAPMKPTEPDGSVEGRVYEFDFSRCRGIGEWMQSWDRRIDKRLVFVDFGESVGEPIPYLQDVGTELKQMADEYMAKRPRC